MEEQLQLFPCVLHDGAPGHNGYGKIYRTWKGQKYHLAHRYAWARWQGRHPMEGKVIMHTCDTPMCVSTDHLREVTQSINELDKWAKGRGNRDRWEKHGLESS